MSRGSNGHRLLQQPHRWLGWLLLVLIWVGLACQSGNPDAALQEKLDAILAASWQFYKSHFIQADGRVVRPDNQNDTVSEGQAYALLRAVWSNDQAKEIEGESHAKVHSAYLSITPSRNYTECLRGIRGYQ